MFYLDGDPDPAVSALRSRAGNAIFHSMEYLDVPGSFTRIFLSIPDPDDPTAYFAGHTSSEFTDGYFRPGAFPAMHGFSNWMAIDGSPWAGHANILKSASETGTDYFLYAAVMGLSISCCSYSSQNFVFFDNYSCYGPELAKLGAFPFLGFLIWRGTSTASKINHTFAKLMLYTQQADFIEPNAPLLFELNWGDQTSLAGFNLQVENLLNTAPPCGPYDYEASIAIEAEESGYQDYFNDSHNAYATQDWSGNNRLTDADHRQGTLCSGTCPNSPAGDDCDFNGLDYMWLFNLFALERGGASRTGSRSTTPYLQGMMNSYYMENFNVNYPDAAGYGSSANKLKLNWLQYLSAVDVISGPGLVSDYGVTPAGWVDFRGAQRIDLKPNFHAQYGCVFMAHIKDYNCSGGDVGDGPYNFAEVNPSEADYREANGDKLMLTDTGWHPIAYYQPGYNARPLPQMDTAGVSDSLADAIINNLDYYKAYYKDSILATIETIRQDTAMAHFIGIDADSLENALYPGQLQIRYDVEVMPNPTSGLSYLIFSISQSANIEIKLTNNVGQDMSYLVNYYEPDEQAGQYKVQLNTDKVVPGMYYVTININGQPTTKMLSVLN